MGKFEKIILVIICISLIMYLQLIEGGAFFLMIFTMLLGGLYFPLGIVILNRISLKQLSKSEVFQSIKTPHLITAVAAGIVFSIVWVGISFKLLRYQGADYMLIAGLIGLAILLVFTLIKYLPTKDVFYKNILLRTIIFTTIGVVLLFVSNLSIVRYQYRNHPDYIKAYERYSANPNDAALRQNLNAEYRKIVSGSEEM